MSRIGDYVIEQQQEQPEPMTPDPDWQETLQADPEFEQWLKELDEPPF